MKKLFTYIAMVFLFPASHAQTCADYVVQLTAKTRTSPPQITLSWPAVSGAIGYNVYKKSKQSTSWGAPIIALGSTASSYIDNNVTEDSTYEYSVQVPGNVSFGYIYAAVKAPAIHNRGTLLLIVDSTFTDSCSTDITQLTADISGDGWRVLRKDFLRTTKDVTVKDYIKSIYTSIPDLKAVLLLGHIAVPYSGNFDTTGLLAPDGHLDHAGAWPADSYYGEMTSTWTDAINNVMGTRAANKNLPGDGKWDQTQLPSALELQVSRIDFANMPAFAKTEIQLMKSYLGKDHQYKTDQLAVNHKTLIDDNFGKFSGEGFAAAGYRLSSLVDNANIQNLDFISTLNTTSYQWAFACGAGSFTTCAGIGSTTDFTTNAVNAIFTIAFGSYFGDWNVQNNFLRAPLCASTPALTSCWSGRPHWYFHHMALGENIGYSTITTQNNINTYANPVNFYPNYIHPALMGDLTLRTDYMKLPTGISLTNIPGAGAKITWTASPDVNVIGYYVYSSDEQYGTYQKRSPMVTTLSYADSFGTDGLKYYMVRAVKLQQTPSGTYYNLSLGNTSSQVLIDYPYADNMGISHLLSSNAISVYPNPAAAQVYITLKGANAGSSMITVSDMQGRKMLEQPITLVSGDNKASLNIEGLPAGIYVLTVTNSASIYTTRVIKTGLK